MLLTFSSASNTDLESVMIFEDGKLLAMLYSMALSMAVNSAMYTVAFIIKSEALVVHFDIALVGQRRLLRLCCSFSNHLYRSVCPEVYHYSGSSGKMFCSTEVLLALDKLLLREGKTLG
ncbi:hypothetical protein CEXT_711481 [Caerostris extrusa]|uniref:Uncharacterized protein n=1 Tax=Caerostris extrusa TaxID=172846 RepID=A0AAV4QX43_CAEEX|nr:hypothetical protein CEXT_711481 [Caerostris extrusa]